MTTQERIKHYRYSLERARYSGLKAVAKDEGLAVQGNTKKAYVDALVEQFRRKIANEK